MPTIPERNDASSSAIPDLIPRVGRLEADVAQLKSDVSQMKVDVSQLKVGVAQINAAIPHLATKADLAPLHALMAVVPHFATKADLAAMETRIIRWMVGSWIATAGVMTAVMTAVIRVAR